MSNLLKSLAVVCGNDKRIIDSNEAVTNKLQEMRRIMTEGSEIKEGFTLGIDPKSVGELLEDDEKHNVMGENSQHSEELAASAAEMLEDANVKAGEILERAEADAGHIVENAKADADAIRQRARTEGLEKGAADGKAKIDEELAKLQSEYLEKQDILEKDYRSKVNDIEPELVDVILDVFANVTRALSPDKKDMILTLVENALKGNEVSGNYIIRACREDAAFLKANKEKIIESVNREVNIEIVEDVLMERNECFIETDFGVYDCSLDIQLENLMRDIKILSCTMEK